MTQEDRNRQPSAFERKRAQITPHLRTFLHPIVPPSPSLRVFEAGCGIGEAALPLVTVLQDRITTPGAVVSYEGVDIEEDEVFTGKLAHRNNPNIVIRTGDLTNPNEFGSPSDVFVMRHPNLTIPGVRSDLYLSIIGNGITALKLGGSFYVSVEHLEERIRLDPLWKVLQEDKIVTISFKGENPNPSPSDILRDSFIITGIKTGPL